jgi:hypothetical protein
VEFACVAKDVGFVDRRSGLSVEVRERCGVDRSWSDLPRVWWWTANLVRSGCANFAGTCGGEGR